MNKTTDNQGHGDHISPVSDKLASTKYAKEIEHSSPVSDSLAQTKFAQAADHESPVSEKVAHTKYAKDIEHISPVSDKLANTKYAQAPDQSLASNSGISLEALQQVDKHIFDHALDETITTLRGIVERSGPELSPSLKIELLDKIFAHFGHQQLNINIKYFSDRKQNPHAE